MHGTVSLDRNNGSDEKLTTAEAMISTIWYGYSLLMDKMCINFKWERLDTNKMKNKSKKHRIPKIMKYLTGVNGIPSVKFFFFFNKNSQLWDNSN